MSEWKQERPPLTETHLAEIRERTKDGNILDWPNVDRAVLLAEVDRLRAQVDAVDEMTASWAHGEDCDAGTGSNREHCACQLTDLRALLGDA